MKIIAYLIAALFFVAIGSVTGELPWFLVIGMLFSAPLEKLFIWLFIDPDFEKRPRRLAERPASAPRIRTIPRYNLDR
ncbi:hypothetical protein [Rhizobium leguminosarum]|uniref:hypothetical protein n=1 Tax=Rhizobium leguminosarum TaxID=384 RepID=UPI003D00D8AA